MRMIFLRSYLGILFMYGSAICLLSACANTQPSKGQTFDQINSELKAAQTIQSTAPRPAAVDKALLMPLHPEVNKVATTPPEMRFDLIVNNAPAVQVFMAIVTGTSYSMLLHPDVAGSISVNLKNVNVLEAMDALRELYGYNYTVQGTRIMVEPLTLQTRIFKVNYLSGRRQGESDVRVTSGSISAALGGSGGGTPSNSANSSNNSNANNASSRSNLDSSRIYTTSDSNFWAELAQSLTAIVGNQDGRQVILNPMSGVIVVRAFPKELRNVDKFLQATQLIVERQVMLEAKIIEVQLKDGFEAGINWAALDSNGTLRGALGVDSRNFDLNGVPLSGSTYGGTLGGGITSYTGRTETGLFSLAFRTKSFASLIQFLDSQGNVQVLSSPRIATLNNQKAVLKVGTDEFFVTNVSTTTTTSGSTSSTSPTITVQPFFSGIALDVTPQIDDENNIILHIHPSISVVAEKTKNINLGTLGTFTIPLASSAINETDSIVRAHDGAIVAIGGLMSQSQSDNRSGIPAVSEIPVVGALFGQSAKSFSKREVVVLLKPTIVDSSANNHQEIQEIQERLQSFDPRKQRTTIRLGTQE